MEQLKSNKYVYKDEISNEYVFSDTIIV
jgi:hypothetical protein